MKNTSFVQMDAKLVKQFAADAEKYFWAWRKRSDEDFLKKTVEAENERRSWFLWRWLGAKQLEVNEKNGRALIKEMRAMDYWIDFPCQMWEAEITIARRLQRAAEIAMSRENVNESMTVSIDDYNVISFMRGT